MRCGCPCCAAYMVQSEGEDKACVCPECGYRCNACLGTGTAISRDALLAMKGESWFTPDFEGGREDE